jgi:hypothetical protein
MNKLRNFSPRRLQIATGPRRLLEKHSHPLFGGLIFSRSGDSARRMTTISVVTPSSEALIRLTRPSGYVYNLHSGSRGRPGFDPYSRLAAQFNLSLSAMAAPRRINSYTLYTNRIPSHQYTKRLIR